MEMVAREHGALGLSAVPLSYGEQGLGAFATGSRSTRQRSRQSVAEESPGDAGSSAAGESASRMQRRPCRPRQRAITITAALAGLLADGQHLGLFERNNIPGVTVIPG